MHNCKVTLKDGRTFDAPIWNWRPAEGWFSLVGDEVEEIDLVDVESAVNEGQRITADRIVDVDLLERARSEGWDGGPRRSDH